MGGTPAGSQQQLEPHLPDQLSDVKSQNELVQIDCEWQVERQQYLIGGRYGGAQVPTAGMAIGVPIICWGFFLAILALAQYVAKIDLYKTLLFSVVTLAAIGLGLWGVYVYSKARKYQKAFAAYKARRARVKSGE